MALPTDHATIATTTEPAPARPPVADPSPPPHGRRSAVLGWAGVGVAVAAVAGLALAVLRPEPSAPVHDNARTVAEHGSVNAVEHHDELIIAARANSVSRTVAEHGSVNAVEHRDQPDGGAPAASTGG